MGDWGYFPTPEAQCHGEFAFQYGLDFHGAASERYETYQRAYSAQIPFSLKQTTRHSGQLKAEDQYVTVAGSTFAVTAVKNSEDDQYLVVRGFNMSDQAAEVQVKKQPNTVEKLNLLEEKQSESLGEELSPYEIRAIGFRR